MPAKNKTWLKLILSFVKVSRPSSLHSPTKVLVPTDVLNVGINESGSVSVDEYIGCLLRKKSKTKYHHEQSKNAKNLSILASSSNLRFGNTIPGLELTGRAARLSRYMSFSHHSYAWQNRNFNLCPIALSTTLIIWSTIYVVLVELSIYQRRKIEKTCYWKLKDFFNNKKTCIEKKSVLFCIYK